MPHLPLIHRVMELIADFTLPKKITKQLASLIIFLSATQFGLHFWPQSAFVYGLRVDYLSPTLYFLDMLIILYLTSQLHFSKLARHTRSNLASVFRQIASVLPFLLVNLLFSQNPWASLAWSFHFLLYLLFVSSLSNNFLRSQFSVLLFSIVFQIILSFIQVTLGHSLQGVFYYLGERMVSVGLPNIAVGSFMGNIVLRAYGTFSHPNILAGYLVIASLIIYRLTFSRLTLLLTSTLTLLGILLTQSRSAALAFFGLIIPFGIIKSFRSRLIYFIISLSLVFYLLPTGLLTRDLDLSIGNRFSLIFVSKKLINAYPIFGTGSNATITRYPDFVPNFRLLQPDHNSFILFLSWFGLVGVMAILYSLRSRFNNLKIYDLRFLFPLLPLLLLDHYLLTSPQGLFISLLYLRIVWEYKLIRT